MAGTVGGVGVSHDVFIPPGYGLNSTKVSPSLSRSIAWTRVESRSSQCYGFEQQQGSERASRKSQSQSHCSL